MAVGRTFDSKIFVGGSANIAEIDNVLGGSINETGSVSPQSFIGQEDNEASIYQIGGSVAFTTIYDTPEFDAAITALLGTSKASGKGNFFSYIGSDPDQWALIPVSFPRPNTTAPANNSIIRPWALDFNGRSMFGTTNSSFEVAAGATSASLGESLDGTADGVDAVIVVILTEASATGITLRDGGTTHNLEARNGIQVVDDTRVAGAVTISATGGTASGYVCIGKKVDLPNG